MATSSKSTTKIREEAHQLSQRINEQASSSYELRKMYDLLAQTSHLIEEVANQVDERFESWSQKQSR